jgi:MFS family permease
MKQNINKQYLSNFLMGVVFSYGIEKLFLRGIGITAAGIGIASAIYLTVTLLLDIPSGILADRWSRKGVLLIAVFAMALYFVLEGTAHSLPQLILAYCVYGIYLVCTSGTYQALMYDVLHESEQSKLYSKINGQAYTLFLVGAGVADLASGFIAHRFGYSAPFFLSIVPCVINVFVILSIVEPTFHKSDHKERILAQTKQAIRSIVGVKLLLSLTVVTTLFTVVENFKLEYGQLYMLHYINSPQLLGILWAMYSFTWALGSLIAHRLHAKLSVLIFLAVTPLIAMSLINSKLGLGLFMVQAVAAAAVTNIIETKIQDATPSQVRASVLSVLSWTGRLIAIPAVLLMGSLTSSHTILWALRLVTIIAVFNLLFWLVAGQNRKLSPQIQTN